MEEGLLEVGALDAELGDPAGQCVNLFDVVGAEENSFAECGKAPHLLPKGMARLNILYAPTRPVAQMPGWPQQHLPTA
jgi:hypothetical protein